MRWQLRRRKSEGRLPSLGQDYGEAHRRYVERVGAGGEMWLRTKPFSAPPGRELLECLRVFSHIVGRLGIGYRAQVLDVGCGPGWLSEFLARCGYSVIGIDVSDDMVRIARERIAAIEHPVGNGIDADAEFHAMQVRDMPWSERFEAAILYDAMHHFDDEVETLRVIRRTLVPGGRIFIQEGVRPEPGSEGERLLVAEMKEYGTLESPFNPAYLLEVLERAGFTHVQRFAAVDELLDLSARDDELRRVETLLDNPPMNTVIAVNPVPAELDEDAQRFAAQLNAVGSLRVDSERHELMLTVNVRNAGRAYWPAGMASSVSHGVVSIGPYLPTEEGQRTELPRQALPRSLSPGESVDLEIRVPQGNLEDIDHVAIDLVHEGIAWFSEYGSQPLVVPLPNER